MTAAEMRPILEAWHASITQADSDIETYLDPLKLTPESPLYQIVWNLQEALTTATSLAVGDVDHWLEWYRAENGMGAKKHEAAPPGGKMRKVRNLRDLARIIGEPR